MAGEKQYIAQTYKRGPMVLSHGQGMHVWDTNGKEYLDFMAGIAVNALGHSDPGMARVIAEQANKLIHTSNLLARSSTGLSGRDTHAIASAIFGRADKPRN